MREWPQEEYETYWLRTSETAGDIETPPPPTFKSPYGRRTFVQWRHNQIFSAYGRLIFLISDASLARFAYWSSTKIPRFDCYLQLLNTLWLLLCQKTPHYICNAEFQPQSTFSICNVSYRKVVQSRNVSVNPTGICKQLKEQYHYSDSSEKKGLLHIMCGYQCDK